MILNQKKLQDIQLGVPVLPTGVYFAKIIKGDVALKPQKNGQGQNLVVPVQILNDNLLTHDGKNIVNRGQIKLRSYISLVEKNGYDPDQKLKELAVACKVPADKTDFELEDIGGFVKVSLTYNAATGQFQESNSVDRFHPIKDDEVFNPPAFAAE